MHDPANMSATDRDAAAPFPQFLAGGGEAGAIIRSTDWTKTPVGPIESWPQSLRLAIGIMLGNKFGMYIAWGPDFTQFYNDGYRPILGSTKHPGAMGHAAAETFAESWHIIQPLFQEAMGGAAVGSEDWLLPLNRHGFLEDCYFTFSYSPIRDELGLVGGVLVTVTETTGRVETEQARQRAMARAANAEKTLRDLLSQAPVGIAALSGPNHVFTLANPRYQELLFGQPRDLFGKSVAEALPEVVAQGYIGLLDEVYRTGRLSEGKEVPLRIEQLDGTTRELFVNFTYEATLGPDGRPTGILAVVFDVTEQVVSRGKLEASEARFRALANSIPQLAWMTDGTGYITWYNQNWYDYTGTTLEHMQGWGWQAVHHPDHTARVTETWKAHLASGEPWEDTFPLRSRTGEWRWFLSRARATRDNAGCIIHWFGTNTDIEEQLSAKQAAEAANATKSAFLANMSHEIRTPLAAILGFSALLKDRGLAPEERDQYVDTITRNGDALTRIIDDILDLAKVEAGRMEVEAIEVPFYDLLAEVCEIFKDKARQKGIFILLNVDEGVPAQILSDPTRLRQILTNLIGNAVKFTAAGEVRIAARSRRLTADKLRISVEIRDTGVGLTPEQQGKLFAPFVQADNSTSRKFGGTGLGLALSQRLAQALGGGIAILESEPGRGSAFIVEFSTAAVKMARAAAAPTKARPATTPGQLRGLRVLIADDSPDNVFLVKRILARNGAAVESANDGAEAVKKALAGPPFDVVLMDIQMPVMDGYQAIRTLRAQGYDGPVVALTAHAMNEERVRTRDAGFAAHLTKPLVADALIDIVATVAKRR